MFINYRSQPVSKLTKSRPEAPPRLGALGRSPVQRLQPATMVAQKSLPVAVPQVSEGMADRANPRIVKIGKGA